jgi:hypothetical protein
VLLILAALLVALGLGFFGLTSLNRDWFGGGSVTPTLAPSPTLAPVVAASPSATPIPAATATGAPSPSPSPSATATATPTATATAQPSPSATATPRPPSPTATPRPPSPSPTPTAAPATLPNVVGRSLDQAQTALLSTGVTVTVQRVNVNAAANDVVAQSPDAGAPLKPGSVVTLQVATGQVAVPDVEGKSQADAQGLLNQAGFRVPTIRQVKDARVADGKAIRTDPEAGRVLPRGADVDLYVSAGRP